MTTALIGERDTSHRLGGVPRSAEAVREVGPAPGEVPVPEGWVLIPAGVVVELRASGFWLRGTGLTPWVLVIGDKTRMAREVRSLGPFQTRTAEADSPEGCGQRRAWVETTGGVLYKP